MKIEQHDSPRRHLLQRATTPKQPLIVALPGFTQRVDPLEKTTWSWRSFNANFVEQSGLSPFATRRNVNVCWIDSSKFGGPWYRRDWTKADLEDVYRISDACAQAVDAGEMYAWGLSDGATLCHRLAQDASWDAVVCRSGPFPKVDVVLEGPPVLVAVGELEPQWMQAAALKAIAEYLAVDRKVTRWVIPGAEHVWDPTQNDSMFDWCLNA